MPKVMIVGNWKMNTDLPGALQLASAISEGSKDLGAPESVESIVCPPFVSLGAVAALLRGSGVAVGAQNIHHEDGGAFTGETSASMLVDLCSYVILGHSERRQHFSETSEIVAMKVQAAIKTGIKPIVCVGEDLVARDDGGAESVVEAQVRESLAGPVGSSDISVAYEPVWAIGSGRAATPELAQAMMSHIRRVLESVYGAEIAAEMSLLYGGSVNAGNIEDFLEQTDINGGLIGGASLNADTFVDIVRRASAPTS